MVGLLGYLRAWKEADAPLDITVFASGQKVIDAVQEVRPDVAVIPFALGMPPWRHFLLQQMRLGGEIAKIRPDVVWNLQYAIRNCSIPQVVHHRNVMRFVNPGFLAKILRGRISKAVKDHCAISALGKSACNVFISNYMRSLAEQLVPESRERNVTIYNCLPSDLLREARSMPIAGGDRPALLAIQDTSVHKDNPTLIRTLKRLVTERPGVAWELHVAGGGDWSPVKKMAEALGVADRIIFHGYVDRQTVGELLRHSLCLVFTSILEGFGNPPLEAMAHGCPVVACNCSAIPEVVGDAGILVTPGSAEEFSLAIIRILEDKRFRQDLVHRGLDHVQQYPLTRSAEQMLGVFTKVGL